MHNSILNERDLRILIKEILCESLENDIEAAPEGSLLDKYAFSPQRQGAQKPPPLEKNNPKESAFLRAIRDHFFGMRPLTKAYGEAIVDFVKKGIYRDVFHPFEGTCYRGMRLITPELLSIVPDLPSLDVGETWKGTGNYLITPLKDRFTSSWSQIRSVTDKFSSIDASKFSEKHKSRWGPMYSVVFEAQSTDNPGRFIDAEPLYILNFDADFEEEFRSESEVIGLGPIRASAVMVRRVV